MAYVLTDNEYADFVEMRRMFAAGRDNSGGGGNGPILNGGSAPRRGPQMVVVEITGDEAGAEVYTCDAYDPAAAFYAEATAPTSANLKGTKIYEDAVFINIQGIGQSGHSLTDAGNTSQKFFVGMVMRATTDTDRTVIVGNAVWLDTCPESLMALAAAESYAPVTTDTTLTFEDTVVLVDATAGDVVITLPGAGDTNVPGTSFTVKKIDSSANIVSVASADLIDGVTDYDLELQYEFVEVTSGGAAFYVTGE